MVLPLHHAFSWYRIEINFDEIKAIIIFFLLISIVSFSYEIRPLKGETLLKSFADTWKKNDHFLIFIYFFFVGGGCGGEQKIKKLNFTHSTPPPRDQCVKGHGKDLVFFSFVHLPCDLSKLAEVIKSFRVQADIITLYSLWKSTKERLIGSL